VTWFVRHSIALAVLLLDAGTRLDELLEPGTQATLASMGPAGSGGWLAYMRRLLSSPASPADPAVPAER
jgi:hypothetical protein